MTKSGNSINVTITMSNNFGLASMNLYVNYDTDVLTIKEVKNRSLLLVVTHRDNLTSSTYGLCCKNGTVPKTLLLMVYLIH